MQVASAAAILLRMSAWRKSARAVFPYAVAATVFLCGCTGASARVPEPAASAAGLGSADNFAPGRRVLLDAHNAYPERGRWGDRLSRALAAGLPVAIEQDLYWHRNARTGRRESVVAHDDDALEGAPTLEAYFFDAIRPIMERALAEGRRETWPLITLNLDFKSNEPEHHDAVLALLAKYTPWLTTAPRTASPLPAPFTVGPLLVLTGSHDGQRQRFHDAVPVGARLLLFGAAPVPSPVGLTRESRARALVRLPPSRLIPERASNYARWVNFSWQAVEEGGAPLAADWSPRDSARLLSLVQRAHRQGYWVRFYTLDGFVPDEDAGFSADYNFGNRASVLQRWRAAIDAGVDFVATDQYEWFREVQGG